ncbi:MAG: S8 family serine peptidase [Luteolibacter sp.]
MLNDYLKAQGGDGDMETRLRNRFNNPLVQQVGLQNLLGENIELNDYAYAKMFMAASHGTHVAGIIKRYSGDKAKLTCATIGAVVSPKVSVVFDEDTLHDLAEKSPDYGAFVIAVLDRYRNEAINKGRRASDYLRTCGAGVANMSWCRPKSFFAGSAARLKKIYKEAGADPSSIDRAYTGEAAERIAELPLELSIADAAAFALAFYENPDVLIVISAGNDHLDNDVELPSPQYLSRFFPNVITVASTDNQGKPSSFTNYGVRSVQVAAPGEQIRSTILGGLEAPMSGTSMAAPVIAGVAAGIRADYPKLAAADLRRIIEYLGPEGPTAGQQGGHLRLGRCGCRPQDGLHLGRCHRSDVAGGGGP